MSSEHIAYMGRSKYFLTYSCLALAMRNVFANFVALLTCNAVAKRCVFADLSCLYTWFIYNTLYNRLKLAGSSHILTKFMDAQRRTALIFVTQGVGCASCMCDWGITWIHASCDRSTYIYCNGLGIYYNRFLICHRVINLLHIITGHQKIITLFSFQNSLLCDSYFNYCRTR